MGAGDSMPRASLEYMKQGRLDEANLVKVQNGNQLAEMGAARLEQYGAEGQQWAQRLRQNPRAALAMAEEYGGFAQIEAGFKYAGAAGQNATAESLGQVALQTGSPEAYKNIMSGSAAYKTGEANLIEANVEKRASDMIWDGGVPGMITGADLEYRMALATGDPTKIREARDRLQSMSRSD
jgi:hypothetical protein